MQSFLEKINQAWDLNRSLVCVGLDPDLEKLPSPFNREKESIVPFLKAIVEATHQYACAFKPQAAFFNGIGAEAQLEEVCHWIKKTYPQHLLILDSKRGDIGNTARMYAKEAFDRYQADAVTVNPYMGSDSWAPFVERAEHAAVILCRTSNPSGEQYQPEVFEKLSKEVQSSYEESPNKMMVVGATRPEELAQVRSLAPNVPFLVPGVGAQGGDIQEVLRNGKDKDGKGLVISSSRGILYSGQGADFQEKAAESAQALFSKAKF